MQNLFQPYIFWVIIIPPSVACAIPNNLKLRKGLFLCCAESTTLIRVFNCKLERSFMHSSRIFIVMLHLYDSREDTKIWAKVTSTHAKKCSRMEFSSPRGGGWGKKADLSVHESITERYPWVLRGSLEEEYAKHWRLCLTTCLNTLKFVKITLFSVFGNVIFRVWFITGNYLHWQTCLSWILSTCAATVLQHTMNGYWRSSGH